MMNFEIVGRFDKISYKMQFLMLLFSFWLVELFQLGMSTLRLLRKNPNKQNHV